MLPQKSCFLKKTLIFCGEKIKPRAIAQNLGHRQASIPVHSGPMTVQVLPSGQVPGRPEQGVAVRFRASPKVQH